jgi:hypothetical protein
MTNNKQQTAVEWFFDNLNNHEVQAEHFKIYQQAKEMNKEQSQAYAAFCVACDRKELPLLEFDGWIKLERGDK